MARPPRFVEHEAHTVQYMLRNNKKCTLSRDCSADCVSSGAPNPPTLEDAAQATLRKMQRNPMDPDSPTASIVL
nr:hypothetical protein CFP56_68322 [Quercus suber]